MAGNIPSLTNENFHMFEPAPIETSLANAATNLQPNIAFPLLQAYHANQEQASQQYQANLDQMHQIQQQEADRAYQNQGFSNLMKAFESVKDPGAATSLSQAGMMPGVDANPWITSLKQTQAATNYGQMGKGFEGFALGGATGPAVTGPITAATGLPINQGPTAMEKAASINAAGRIAAARVSGAGGPSFTAPLGEPGPNQITAHWKGDPGNIPQLPASMQPAQAAPNSVPAIQAAVTANLPKVAQRSPGSYSDIAAGSVNGKPNVVFDANHNTYVIQGKNNQYPVAPFLR